MNFTFMVPKIIFKSIHFCYEKKGFQLDLHFNTSSEGHGYLHKSSIIQSLHLWQRLSP